MPRQVDEPARGCSSRRSKRWACGFTWASRPRQFTAKQSVERIEFTDGDSLDVDMIIVSAGIRPRDELAKQAGLRRASGAALSSTIGWRRPIRDIFAIGECALHRGMVYGLVAPGYEMAEDRGRQPHRRRAAVRRHRSVDQAEADGRRRRQLRQLRSAGRARPRRWCSRIPSPASTRSCCSRPMARGCWAASWSATPATTASCSMFAKGDEPLPCQPHELLVGSVGGSGRRWRLDAMPDAAQICSCNNVSKGAICAAIREQELDTVDAVKTVHQGRHRLRRLHAAGHRSVQGRDEEGRQGGRRIICASTSPTRGPSCSRSSRRRSCGRFADVLADYGQRQWLRNLQAGRGLDPGQPVERRHPAARASDAAGHQRPLPGQHAAGRARTRSCRACPAARSRPRS